MNLKARTCKLEAANAARKAIQDRYSGGTPLEIYRRMLQDRSYCPGKVTTATRIAGDITPEQAYKYMITGNLP
jgi:hypothetical protein